MVILTEDLKELDFGKCGNCGVITQLLYDGKCWDCYSKKDKEGECFYYDNGD